MKEFDIHEGMPSVKEAMEILDTNLNLFKGQKIVKVIHGYGSSGTGGKIKKSCHSHLELLKQRKKIKDYIPGESFSKLDGKEELISKYKQLLKNDPDYNKSNDGITYVILS